MNPETFKSKMIKLYFARDELEKALVFVAGSIIFSFMVFFAFNWLFFNDTAFHPVIEKEMLDYLLEGLIVWSSFDFIGRLFKYRNVVFLKHSDAEHSRCQCGSQRRSKWLIFVTHTVEPVTRRLDFSCLYCKKIIYHCDIAPPKKDFDFDIDIK